MDLEALGVLVELQAQGIRLQVRNGRLQVDGALTPELRRRIAACKDDLLALLEKGEEHLAALERELDALCERWQTLEERIARGRIYCHEHPDDDRAAVLLTTLEREREEVEQKYHTTNTHYKALHDTLVCGNRTWDRITLRWPAQAPVVTIGGKWRRLPSGEIEATYTREELILALAVMRKTNERR